LTVASAARVLGRVAFRDALDPAHGRGGVTIAGSLLFKTTSKITGAAMLTKIRSASFSPQSGAKSLPKSSHTQMIFLHLAEGFSSVGRMFWTGEVVFYSSRVYYS
jgi:hypothetical protein